MAGLTDLTLTSPTARADFVATYGGFQIGFGLFLLACIRNDTWLESGLWAATAALGGFASLRVLTMVLNRGRVRRTIWLGLGLEVLGLALTTWGLAQTQPPSRPRLPLELLPDTLAICRLPADAPLPPWASTGSNFVTISRTPEELSITAVQRAIPSGVRCERDYRAVRVRGPLSLDLIGILASIAEPLAEAGLSIFAISTFDTDYVLVKDRDLEAAVAALERAGHQVSR
jgi:hypothetical protein